MNIYGEVQMDDHRVKIKCRQNILDPSVKFTWKLCSNNEDINITDKEYTGSSLNAHDPVLAINDVYEGDSREFQLVAEDGKETVTSNTLSLKDLPFIEIYGEFDCDKMEIRLYEKCTSGTVLKRQWQKIVHVLLDNTLNIDQPFLKSDDIENDEFHPFRLVASNDFGDCISNKISIRDRAFVIISGPTVAMKGHAILCSNAVLSKNKIEELKWQLPFTDKSTSLTGQHLDISHINENHRGTYQLRVKTAFGFGVSNQIHINVYDVNECRNQEAEQSNNFLRIFKLSAVGAKAMCAVFKQYIPAMQFIDHLRDIKKSHFKECRFDPQQRKILYPGGSNRVSQDDLDVAILYKLLRHTVKMAEPANGWGEQPNEENTDNADDIERIHHHRNELCHNARSLLSTENFNASWLDLSKAIYRLSGGRLIKEVFAIQEYHCINPSESEGREIKKSKDQYFEEALKSCQDKSDIKTTTVISVQVQTEEKESNPDDFLNIQRETLNCIARIENPEAWQEIVDSQFSQETLEEEMEEKEQIKDPAKYFYDEVSKEIPFWKETEDITETVSTSLPRSNIKKSKKFGVFKNTLQYPARISRKYNCPPPRVSYPFTIDLKFKSEKDFQKYRNDVESGSVQEMFESSVMSTTYLNMFRLEKKDLNVNIEKLKMNESKSDTSQHLTSTKISVGVDKKKSKKRDEFLQHLCNTINSITTEIKSGLQKNVSEQNLVETLKSHLNWWKDSQKTNVSSVLQHLVDGIIPILKRYNCPTIICRVGSLMFDLKFRKPEDSELYHSDHRSGKLQETFARLISCDSYMKLFDISSKDAKTTVDKVTDMDMSRETAWRNNDLHPILSTAVCEDMASRKFHSAFTYPALWDERFLSSFIRLLDSKDFSSLRSLFLTPYIDFVDLFEGAHKGHFQASEKNVLNLILENHYFSGSEGTNEKTRAQRAISWIIYYGHMELLIYIIMRANRELGDKDGILVVFGDNIYENTRLFILGCLSGNVGIVKMLLDFLRNYINVDLYYLCYYIPRFMSLYKPCDFMFTPITAACYSNVECVRLLLSKGVDINPRYGLHPLFIACSRGNRDIVSLLIDSGADVDGSTYYVDIRPIHIACERGHGDVVRLLIEKRAKLNGALNVATKHGHFGLVKLLTENGVDVNDRTDIFRIPPLVLAYAFEYNNIAEYLVKHSKHAFALRFL